MRAAVLEEHGEPLSIEEVDAPEPAPDGAVVELEACGVCRSDWHGWQGDWGGSASRPNPVRSSATSPPATSPPSATRSRPSARVTTSPSRSTRGRDLPRCQRGHSNICENVMPLGFIEQAQGAFAEQVHVPVADHNLVELPDGVSSVDMAGLGCRFMTSFHALAHRADVGAGDWVSIHGCGGVGLSAVHIADALGANVVAVDLKDEKLEKAEGLGAGRDGQRGGRRRRPRRGPRDHRRRR